MANPKLYCVKCKDKKECKSVVVKRSKPRAAGKKGTPMICGSCVDCGTKMNQFIKEDDMAKYEK